MKKHIYLLGFAFLIPKLGSAQTLEERRKIALNSDQYGNIHLLNELKKEDAERKSRLNNFLSQNPAYKKTIKIGSMGKQELLDVLPNGNKVFAKTTNAGAATTARANHLYNGGSLGINVQGQNMTAAVWDGGNVRNTHQEFMVGAVSKITLADGSNFENHATHVAGT
ncbi:hypothetical protein AB4Y90_06850, partial [Chryseobacterium sp. 2TAF14]